MESTTACPHDVRSLTPKGRPRSLDYRGSAGPGHCLGVFCWCRGCGPGPTGHVLRLGWARSAGTSPCWSGRRPPPVMPANRLRSGPVGGRGHAVYRPPARAPCRGRLPRRSVARSAGAGRRPIPRPPPSGAGRRRSGAGTCSSPCWPGWSARFLVALIPGLSVMWSVQVVVRRGLCLGYVALLVRMRNLAAERELKLTFMPPPARAARAGRAYDLGRRLRRARASAGPPTEAVRGSTRSAAARSESRSEALIALSGPATSPGRTG